MVLMTFALSQSEVSGWNKPVIIVTLILSCVAFGNGHYHLIILNRNYSVVILLGFTYAERKVRSPS
jgi:hypothetical protein